MPVYIMFVRCHERGGVNWVCKVSRSEKSVPIIQDDCSWKGNTKTVLSALVGCRRTDCGVARRLGYADSACEHIDKALRGHVCLCNPSS
jgi:hypothetical protein